MFCKKHIKIVKKHRESHAASTVLRVHNGRYEHEHRPFSMFITVDVRWLSDGVRPIFKCHLSDYNISFRFYINGLET